LPYFYKDREIVGKIWGHQLKKLKNLLIKLYQAARGFVAQMSCPSNIADTGVRVITAVAVNTTNSLLADLTTITAPAVIANTLSWGFAVAVAAVVTNGDVAEGPFPTFVTVAFERVQTRPVFTTGHDNALSKNIKDVKYSDQGSISPIFYSQLLHLQIPKVQKTVKSSFVLLGSACAKAACKTLVKLTLTQLVMTC
jgi:hypothetical protein